MANDLNGWSPGTETKDELRRQLAAANERAGQLEYALQCIIAEYRKAEGERDVCRIARDALWGRYPSVNEVSRKTLEL